ncbi:hypothetical protein SI65_08821 [Aspergillus cristatus]|uniref:F-box domain-containing protein n=1 Tax=Aspergillus cristatus TaxID=573508 RepID=A0A1E3B3R7_ASPCR|nr:hypothetical protein SI65_08821 [Aspergillus cristatus]
MRTIVDLPPELLFQVVSDLPLLTKACLVLSSRRLYKILGFVLEAKELHFLRTPQNGQRYVDSKEYEANDFLTQLEDDTWACRGRCQRLHPRKEFLPRKLKKHAPQKKACEAWAGIVDLCPCISLTLRDRARLIEYLEAPKDEKPKLNLVTKDVLSDLDKKYLLHEYTPHPGIGMELQLFTTDSGQLNTSARYEKLNPGFRWIDLATVPSCSIQDCFWDAKTKSATQSWNCRRCNARATSLSMVPEKVSVVHVARSLGMADPKSSDAQMLWYKQCRCLSDYIPT